MLRVSLVGNLGADPEVRFSQKGTQVVQFRVAVNQIRTGPDGERQESTEWFRIRVANRMSEFVQRLTKGTRVLVIGRLDIGRYQTKEGETRTSYDVWADEIQSMSSRTAGFGEGDGMQDPDAEAPEPASVGVSSLASSGAGRNVANGKSARSNARADSSSASRAADELEDLPF